MTYPLGVDIGTTYTAAALWRDGRVQTVPLGNRANAVASVLFLREDGSMLVGEAAARRGIIDPDRQAREFKRRMGDDIPILIGGRGMTAHQLTGEVLRFVLERVSELQGGPPNHVVLTHPAAWGDYRKNLLVQAARQAGLREVGLLPEPVAAATWYASQERIDPGSLIGIYDFGGGTFDASVVRKTATGVEIFGEAGGDDSIGGIDFDHALFRHVGSLAGADVSQLDMADQMTASQMAQLFTAVVEAKEALSADVEVVIPVVLPGLSRQVLITRAEFEDLIRQRVLGTVGVFGQVVRRAGVDPAKLHGVLLVGGSSRIPLVRQLLSQELGIRVAVDAHPKYTVSLGAAIAAAPRFVGVRSSAGFAPPGPVRPMPPPPLRPPPPIRPQFQPVPPPPPGAGGPGPGQRSDAGIQAPPAPAVSQQVDLARSGLTGIQDVRAVLASMMPSEPVVMTPPPPRGDGVTEFRTGKSSGRGRWVALLVVLLIAAVVAVLIFVLQDKTGTSGEPSTSPSATPAPAVPGPPPVGTITLSGGQLVTAPDGGDQMTAVTGMPNGNVVAVGYSVTRKPRAWVYPGSGDFTVADVQVDKQGAILDVATLGSTVVGVGWTGEGTTVRAAVWTTSDGSKWTLLDPAGEFRPNSGIKQLSAVVVTPDNKLLAIGSDVRNDKDGDSQVYTSSDGRTWAPAPTSGLSGTGPQDVVRLTLASDKTFVAMGSVLDGAGRGPAFWTSTDGQKWDLSPYHPEGKPSLQGITRQPNGQLMACGTIGTAVPPTLGCWTQASDQHWERWEVKADANSPQPLLLYGMYPATQIVIVGLGQPKSGTGNDAAMWIVNFGPHK